jgi:hypothetical protein
MGNHDKRNVLACIASIFYPIGLLEQFIVTWNIFMQRLLQDKLQWNDISNRLTQTLEANMRSTDKTERCADRQTSFGRRFCSGHSVTWIFRLIRTCLHMHAHSNNCSVDTEGNITIKLPCSKSRVAHLNNSHFPDWNYVER